jgi:membrane peptidoglycan carboxypeptidase
MTNSKGPKRPDTESDQLPPKEAAQRRDAILKRMLQTKPKQQKDLMAERRSKISKAER